MSSTTSIAEHALLSDCHSAALVTEVPPWGRTP
jgi:hypothetical protein